MAKNMENTIKRIGKRIRFFIKKNGYPSVESFAYSNNIEKSALGKIINEKRKPRIDTLIKISEALGITINDLYLRVQP